MLYNLYEVIPEVDDNDLEAQKGLFRDAHGVCIFM